MKNLLMVPMFRGSALLLALMVATASGSAWAEEDLAFGCPGMTHTYGPFDYRTATKEQKVLVEGAHFLPQVENLIKGHRGYLGGDIDYTLRAFPNSPRALMSMAKLFERNKMAIPQGAKAPLRCYFEHAIRFRQDDPIPRVLYGIHLLRMGDSKSALLHLEKAAALNDVDPNTNYNLGLAYFQLKRYDEALAFAHRAYAAGFPLPGLRNMLSREGKWKDLPPEPIEAGSGPSAQP